MSTLVTALRALWQDAERKLYPLAVSAPDRYERAVLLTRAVADQLASVGTTDELVARWEEHEAITAAGAAKAGLAVGGLLVGDVAGAAFSLRLRELQEREQVLRMTELIDAARSEGAAWVKLHERGTLANGLADPYHAVELHLDSGTAIVTSVEPSFVDGSPNCVLNVILLDPASGTPVDLDPRIVEPVELTDPAAVQAATADLRRTVEAR